MKKDFIAMTGAVILALSAAACSDPVRLAPVELIDDPSIEWYFDPRAVSVKGFEAGPADMARFAEADFAAFGGLKTVVLKLTENPKAPDAAKEAKVREFESALPWLDALAGAPGLENIVLKVGEGLFIRATEAGKLADPERANLERAWKRLAGKLRKNLKGKQVFIQSWGW